MEQASVKTLGLVNPQCVLQTLAHVWTHLVLLPSPEEVDRPVLPPLDDRPASLSPTLLTPGLQEAVGTLRAEQVDPAGGLT